MKLEVTLEQLNEMLDYFNESQNKCYRAQVAASMVKDTELRQKSLERFMMLGEIISQLETAKEDFKDEDN